MSSALVSEELAFHNDSISNSVTVGPINIKLETDLDIYNTEMAAMPIMSTSSCISKKTIRSWYLGKLQPTFNMAHVCN